MNNEDALGTRLLARLDQATSRNQKVINNNKIAIKQIDKVLPRADKLLGGNSVISEAMHLIADTLREDGEELSQMNGELLEAKAALEVSNSLLAQAGLDFSNIQTFAKDEIWLGDHLPTIKRALNVFNLVPKGAGDVSLFEQALDSLEKERFEDIAHAVKRSGQKREKEE